MSGQVQYGDHRTLTSQETRPANAVDAIRLHAFRHELRAACCQADRTALLRLTDRARELGLTDDQISAELQEIRVTLDALDFAERLSSEGLPIVHSVERLTPGDRCHFTTPVHFGRRRSDQHGHLVFTSIWLRFHGALDMSVVWSEVESVRRDGRDIAVSLKASQRVLRFCCHSAEEAVRGDSVARHLVATAHA